MAFQTVAPPTVGSIVTVRGMQVRVMKVYPFGTMDVEALESGRWFRVTGLGWL